jgi:peptidyl-tRNA hydrolase
MASTTPNAAVEAVIKLIDADVAAGKVPSKAAHQATQRLIAAVGRDAAARLLSESLNRTRTKETRR